jgi:D-alanyl-D-alanine carboxypeptidase
MLPLYTLLAIVVDFLGDFMSETIPHLDFFLESNHSLMPVNGNRSGLQLGYPSFHSRTASLPFSLDYTCPYSKEPTDSWNDDSLVLRGSLDDDYLKGNCSDNILYGYAGKDYLIGNYGSDLLNGGTGKDYLIGGKGNDILIDYDGEDLMIGGQGSDLFCLSSWSQPDTSTIIADFQIGTDKIKVGRLGATFDDLTVEDSRDQNNQKRTTIKERGNTLAVLLGVEASRLTANSFIFGDPDLAGQFQNALDKSLKSSNLPGTTVAVITPNGFTWEGATGVSDLSSQNSMSPDQVFNIGAVTETFAAATVLKLTEIGTLSLDDTLGKWLPDIAQNIPDGKSITIRQILNGTSGIYYYREDEQWRFDILTDFLSGSTRNWTSDDLVAYTYDKPRFSGDASSSVWTYPGTGTVLAKLIVEKATNSSFASVMREQVLNLLGLNNTFFSGEKQLTARLASGYQDALDVDGNLGQDGILENFTNINPLLFSASGTLFSSSQDIARFYQALFSGELLKSNSLKEMLTFVNEGTSYEGDQYGLGIASFENSSQRKWGKGGDNPGYSSEMRYFPDQGSAMVVALANGGSDSDTEGVVPVLEAAQTVLLQKVID